ncbi:RNA polymerase sigma-70 factor, ECF subfamily [Clostridium cavendishii DSM 21758]|uniref:RNA polymerase sigma-70 factor, ECF subfamily n=1 Tax=Clostridium cavendishii DSM 21758 TaxID=1121302 RepID=A0A1M6BMK8_9CLOT|nr:RNA polymerase sigma-70 factor, ECF subfamily [Clostridium cavendishii DSM 21758]
MNAQAIEEGEFNLNRLDLVRRAKAGDKEAFIELIRNNKLSLYKIAKNILKNDHDVGDAISDTILKAYENINTLENNEYFKTWLIRILINKCNEIHRKNSKVILIDKNENPFDTYYDIYEDIDLNKAIAVLDEDLRVLIHLYYYEDLSLSSISDILSIPQGTIKSRLARARKNLYEVLKEE